jgi:hypothetical protein
MLSIDRKTASELVSRCLREKEKSKQKNLIFNKFIEKSIKNAVSGNYFTYYYDELSKIHDILIKEGFLEMGADDPESIKDRNIIINRKEQLLGEYFKFAKMVNNFNELIELPLPTNVSSLWNCITRSSELLKNKKLFTISAKKRLKDIKKL